MQMEIWTFSAATYSRSGKGIAVHSSKCAGHGIVAENFLKQMCLLRDDNQPTGICSTALLILIIPHSSTFAQAERIVKLHLSSPLTNFPSFLCLSSSLATSSFLSLFI